MLYFRMSLPRRVISRLGPGAFALPWLYMALITFLSHLQGSGTPSGGLLLFGIEIPIYYGNLLHVPLYFGLAFVWHVALERTSLSRAQKRLLVIVLTAAFGILDEFHQSFVPGRDPSFGDVASDTFGAILATVCWRFLRPVLFATETSKVTEAE